MNAAFNSAYQQAVAEGVSVFVAAGDEGAASCDYELTTAIHGIGVSSYASTPYNVAAGGTDFGDTYQGINSTYWSPTNSATYGSALSYIPEIPWNDSCAGSIVAVFLGFSVGYGPNGFCGSSLAQQDGDFYRGRGQRRAQRVRNRRSGRESGCGGQLQGIRQTFVANGSARDPERWRPGYSRRIDVRRQRNLGSLLCVLLFRS